MSLRIFGEGGKTLLNCDSIFLANGTANPAARKRGDTRRCI